MWGICIRKLYKIQVEIKSKLNEKFFSVRNMIFMIELKPLCSFFNYCIKHLCFFLFPQIKTILSNLEKWNLNSKVDLSVVSHITHTHIHTITLQSLHKQKIGFIRWHKSHLDFRTDYQRFWYLEVKAINKYEPVISTNNYLLCIKAWDHHFSKFYSLH